MANLLKDLEPNKLLPNMTGVLDDKDYAQINSLKTRYDQAETLLLMLPRRGDKAFHCFIKALEKEQPYLTGCFTDASGKF